MAHMVEINDSKDGLLTVTLPMLLDEISPSGEKLHWSIFYLSATGDLGDDRSIVDFENEISDSDKGFFLSWNELKTLSVKFDQVFDTLIVGAANKEDIKKYDDDEKLYSNFDVVLDLFDGAYWRVYSEDDSIIKKMANKFSEVKLSR